MTNNGQNQNAAVPPALQNWEAFCQALLGHRPPLPEFKALSYENPRTYLQRCEEYLTAYQVPNAQKTRTIEQGLYGEARQWWLCYKDLDVEWQRFRELLINRFDSDCIKAQLLGQLYSRKQGERESVGAFLQEKYLLFQRVQPEVPEANRLKFLLELLRPALRKALRPMVLNNFADLLTRAMDAERDDAEERLTAPKTSRPVSSGRPAVIAEVCTGHTGSCQLPKIRVRLGEQEIMALVDPAATANLVNPRILPASHRVEGSTEKFHLAAEGATLQVSGSADCCISIQERPFTITTMVAPRLRHPLILGLPWLEAEQGVLDLTQHVLHIGRFDRVTAPLVPGYEQEMEQLSIGKGDVREPPDHRTANRRDSVTAAPHCSQPTALPDGSQGTALSISGIQAAASHHDQPIAPPHSGQPTALPNGSQGTASPDRSIKAATSHRDQPIAPPHRSQPTALPDGSQGTASLNSGIQATSSHRDQAIAPTYHGQPTALPDGSQGTASPNSGIKAAFLQHGPSAASPDSSQGTASSVSDQQDAPSSRHDQRPALAASSKNTASPVRDLQTTYTVYTKAWQERRQQERYYSRARKKDSKTLCERQSNA